MENKKNFFLFFPSFHNSQGHEIAFIKIFKKISKFNNLNTVLLNAENSKIKFQFENIRIFPSFLNLKLPFKFLLILFLSVKTLIKLLSEKKLEIKKNDIILIDSTSYGNLASILIYLYLCAKKNNIFFYKRVIEKNYFIDKIFLYFLQRIFLKVTFLTDSDLILKYLKKNLKNIYNLPIPHTYKKKFNYKKKTKYIKIWFPGKLRDEKGVNNLRSVLINNKNYDKIKFYCDKEFKIKHKYKFFYTKLNNLSSKKYLDHFRKMDLILLPYSHKSYKYRTSGIFIEAVSLGKICIVPDNTWMSQIYKKAKLDTLVIKNWIKLDFENFSKIVFTKKNYFKLLKLKKNIRNIHNEENYFNNFNKIINLVKKKQS
jgi:hypothetical protein